MEQIAETHRQQTPTPTAGNHETMGGSIQFIDEGSDAVVAGIPEPAGDVETPILVTVSIIPPPALDSGLEAQLPAYEEPPTYIESLYLMFS